MSNEYMLNKLSYSLRLLRSVWAVQENALVKMALSRLPGDDGSTSYANFFGYTRVFLCLMVENKYAQKGSLFPLFS